MTSRITSFAILVVVLACSREHVSTWSDARESVAGDDHKNTYIGKDGGTVQIAPARVSDEHGFGLVDEEPVGAEIFTGKSLLVAGECFANNPQTPRTYTHLDSYLDMLSLLALYAPPGKAQAWWWSAINSLGETNSDNDPDGINRPRVADGGPVVPAFARRIGVAANAPSMWKLTGVRFRWRDDPMQIKLAYELDRPHALPDRSIASAHMIYSIALPQALKAQFKAAVHNIPQDQALAGCAVHNLLKYYLPQGSFFFLHSNVFDTREAANQWVLAEFKPVKHDQTLQPVIAGPYDMKPGVADDEDTLRIVPMTFAYQRVVDEENGVIAPSALPPLVRWSSGTKSDLTSLPRQGDLLVGPNDEDIRYPERTPARKHESAWICAECHTRRSGTTIDTSKTPDELRTMPSMVARHIGFGDGGNCATDPFFGVPRAYLQASLSEYLLDSAGAQAFYNHTGNPTKPYIDENKCLEATFHVAATTVAPCTASGPSMTKTIKLDIKNENIKSIPLSNVFTQDGSQVVQDTCSGKTLKFGDHCTFNLQYDWTPSANSANVLLQFNTTEFSQFEINGVNTPGFDNSCVIPPSQPASVELTSTPIDNCTFQPYMNYWTKSIQYKIKNTDATRILYPGQIDQYDGGSSIGNNCSGASLTPGQSCTFDVAYWGATATNTVDIHVTEDGFQFNDFAFTTLHGDNSCQTPTAVPFQGNVTVDSVECNPWGATVQMRVKRTGGTLPASFMTWSFAFDGEGNPEADWTYCANDPGINVGCTLAKTFEVWEGQPYPASFSGTMTDANHFYEPFTFTGGIQCP